jgi:hypothetical protein
MSLKGNETNHIKGSSASASKATGQQSTKRMHHATKRIRAFISFFYQENPRWPAKVSIN